MSTDKNIKEINEEVKVINDRQERKEIFWITIWLIVLGILLFGFDRMSWPVIILLVGIPHILYLIVKNRKNQEKETPPQKQEAKPSRIDAFNKELDELKSVESNELSFSVVRCLAYGSLFGIGFVVIVIAYYVLTS